MVIKAGRVLTETRSIYQTARYKRLHIPILCVVTGCENVEPTMATWVSVNQSTLKGHELEFVNVVATCFTKSGRLGSSEVVEALKSQSQRDVWCAICAAIRIA
jgi:hypothetical protein